METRSLRWIYSPVVNRRALQEVEARKVQLVLLAAVDQLRRWIATLQPALDWHVLKR